MNARDALLKMPIVAGVPVADLDRLLEQAPPLPVEEGEILMEAGDEGEDLVLVLHGGFAVELGSGDETLPLAFVGPGEILGEAALFRRGSQRSARVRAVARSLVLRMDSALLDRLAQEGNALPRAVEEAVMRTLARRVHDSILAIDGVLAQGLDEPGPKGALARLREFFGR